MRSEKRWFGIALLGLMVGFGGVAGAEPVGSTESAGKADAAKTEGAKTEEGSGKEGEAAATAAAAATEGEVKEGDTSKGAEKKKVVIGPGGRPLRSDYPGTPESLLPSTVTTATIQSDLQEGRKTETDYMLEVRDIEAKIEDLRSRVFESKTRIVLLKETLLSGNLEGARGVVVFVNELGRAFETKQLAVSLDGSQVFNKAGDDPVIKDKEVFDVFVGSLSPGIHVLSITGKFEGSGGMFSYFDSYKFALASTCELETKPGVIAAVSIVAKRSSDITARTDEEPYLECEITYRDVTMADVEQATDHAKDQK